MSTPIQLAMGMEAPHRNQYLFSDHYLNHLLPADPRWGEALDEAREFLAWLQDLYAREGTQLPHYGEPQLEDHWFGPILAQLGHVFERQAGVPGLNHGVKRPDYVFFPDARARRAAVEAQRTADYAAKALAAGEVKRWEVPLGKKQKGGGASFEAQNPSWQIDYYLRAAGLDWGLLTNGRAWRLVHRDSSHRLSIYYEIDLIDLLHRGDPGGLRYFTLFFRQAAFRPDAQGRLFLGDALRASSEYAIALEEDLEENVYRALEHLIQGFLDLPDNRLGPDGLREIYDNSLYLLYRLLFILYAESRGLLPLENRQYREHYSLTDIKRDIAEGNAPRAPTTTVMWNRLKTLFHIINGDDPGLNRYLDVPRYNGGLFSREVHPFLEEKAVGDRELVAAVDLLCRRETAAGREFVDYRTLGVRHLGSIYEGLLEYQPRYAAGPMLAIREDKGERWVAEEERPLGSSQTPRVLERRAAGQVYLETDKGERKATGSYYTPQYIVEYIVKNTLGPLVAEARERVKARARGAKGKAARAQAEQSIAGEILDLKALDPAMGSGHFLVEATEYLALELATDPYLETDAPAEEDLSHWRRRVVERCIYGVDKNPLAVELAKLSLWLATVAADKPLSFLDHHLKCGDSLVGARAGDLGWAPPAVLSKKAQKQLEQQKAGQINMFEYLLSQQLPAVMGRILEITEVESDSYETVQAKEVADKAVRDLKAPFEAVADLWVSAYFGHEFTPDDYDRALELIHRRDELLALPAVRRARTMGEERRFFHWELAFPEVFYDRNGQPLRDKAGFDAVVGNPPYGDILDQTEKKFLLAISSVKTGGRAEVYANFLARSIDVLAQHKYLAFIVPNTLIDGAQFDAFREYLTSRVNLRSIRDFRNRQVFADADVMTMILVLNTIVVEESYSVLYEYWDDSCDEFQLAEMIVRSSTPGPWRLTNKVIRRIETRGLCLSLEPGIGSCHDAGVDYKWKNVGWQNRGAREPLSKIIFYSGKRRHPEDYCLIKGENVDRYALQFDNHYLVHDFEKHRTPDNTILVYLEFALVPTKLLTRQTSDRIQAALDEEQFVTAKSVHTTLVKAGQYSPWYMLAVLNGRLLTYIYQLRTGESGRTFAQVKLYDLRQLPIRRIDFTTPTDERQRLADKGRALYDQFCQKEDYACVLDFVEGELSRRPERSDAVHDLLAFLAGQMIDMNKAKAAAVESFWLDLEGAAGPGTFEVLRNRGKQEASLWQQHACRPFVDGASRSARTLDESLAWSEDAFKAFVKALAGTVAGLSDLVHVYRAHSPAYRDLAARLETTDRLIDRVVYRLYGLSEEEIRMVEEAAG